jgi:hypothetical protein
LAAALAHGLLDDRHDLVGSHGIALGVDRTLLRVDRYPRGLQRLLDLGLHQNLHDFRWNWTASLRRWLAALRWLAAALAHGLLDDRHDLVGSDRLPVLIHRALLGVHGYALGLQRLLDLGLHQNLHDLRRYLRATLRRGLAAALGRGLAAAVGRGLAAALGSLLGLGGHGRERPLL